MSPDSSRNSTPKVALAFFPHAFWPPSTGAHHRFVEILRGFLDLGYATHAISFDSGFFLWTRQRQQAARQALGPHFHLHVVPAWTFWSKIRHVIHLKASFERKIWILGGILKGAKRAWRHPYSTMNWFQAMADAIAPDVFYYAYSGDDEVLRPKFSSPCLCLLDVHDFVRLNHDLQSRIAQAMESFAPGLPPADSEVLREDFSLQPSHQPTEDEWNQLAPFDAYLAIAEEEGNRVRRAFPTKKTVFLPVTQPIATSANTYQGFPLLSLGPNFFNLQGLYYFIQRVQPRVLPQIPDFRLLVTGFLPPESDPSAGAPQIERLGFVPDLARYYAQAPFFVCSTFAGTGQQIKIVQAMAHGLPVIALRWAAQRSPLLHEINGLIVDEPAGFADAVIRLWQDRNLCRRLGQTAQTTIAENFSSLRCQTGLREILRAQEKTDESLVPSGNPHCATRLLPLS